MKHTRPLINTLATLFFLTIFASLVHAQSTAQRTFVSTSGNDANTASLCSAQNPCRSFTSALSVTTAGGEIVPLTSGGYGAVTINKSVQIIAPFGVYAAITAPSGNAISVAAGANDTVVLKGLTINGLGTGASGIRFTSGKTLHIESCTVTGFTGVGALFVSTNANNTRVYIKDTIVRNNLDSGLFFRSSSGLLYVSIDGTRAEGNTQNGFVATAGARVTITNSISSGNGASGFVVTSQFAIMTDVGVINCDGCAATNNGDSGFRATIVGGTGSTMRVARSSATNNTGFGFRQDNGDFGATSVFESLQGTNFVRDNGTNRSGTITTIDPDAP